MPENQNHELNVENEAEIFCRVEVNSRVALLFICRLISDE